MKVLLKNCKSATYQSANTIENIKEATTKGWAYEAQCFYIDCLNADLPEQVFRADCTRGVCACCTSATTLLFDVHSFSQPIGVKGY